MDTIARVKRLVPRRADIRLEAAHTPIERGSIQAKFAETYFALASQSSTIALVCTQIEAARHCLARTICGG
jgi:hypothetical protein